MGDTRQQGVVRFVEQAYGLLAEMSYYRLLNLKGTASSAEVKKAYYRLAGRLHPDLWGKQLDDDFRQKLVAVYSRVVEAYKVLSDGKRRKLYDSQLRKGVFRLTADAEAGPKHDRPEDKISNPHAKKFYKLGMSALESGDRKSALMNLKLALSADPANRVIKAALARAEGK